MPLLLSMQHCTTQVGKLDCQGLARAYVLCASAGLDAPPLLGALRKATRQRLHSMAPHQLVSVLAGLAGLGHQDLLLLDELARWGREQGVLQTLHSDANALRARLAGAQQQQQPCSRS